MRRGEEEKEEEEGQKAENQREEEDKWRLAEAAGGQWLCGRGWLTRAPNISKAFYFCFPIHSVIIVSDDIAYIIPIYPIGRFAIQWSLGVVLSPLSLLSLIPSIQSIPLYGMRQDRSYPGVWSLWKPSFRSENSSGQEPLPLPLLPRRKNRKKSKKKSTPGRHHKILRQADRRSPAWACCLDSQAFCCLAHTAGGCSTLFGSMPFPSIRVALEGLLSCLPLWEGTTSSSYWEPHSSCLPPAHPTPAPIHFLPASQQMETSHKTSILVGRGRENPLPAPSSIFPFFPFDRPCR